MTSHFGLRTATGDGTLFATVSAMAKTKILFALMVSAAVGCGGEENIEPVESLPWVESAAFRFELKNQFTSHSAEDRVFFLGRDTLSTVQRVDGEESIRHAFLGTRFGGTIRMPMNDRILVVPGERSIAFYPTRNPVSDRTSALMEMSDVDPDFRSFDLPRFETSLAVLLDHENRVLVSYVTNDGSYKLLLVQLDVTDSLAGDEISVRSNRLLPSLNRALALHEFDNNFYVTTFEATQRIDAQGNVDDVASPLPLRKMFQVEGLLVGINFESIYSSTDGVHWTTGGNSETLRLLRYTQARGLALAYYNSQIFQLTREGTSLQIRELNNEGLSGHEITSIAVLEDKVFVTTLSGVFEKALEDFDRPTVSP